MTSVAIKVLSLLGIQNYWDWPVNSVEKSGRGRDHVPSSPLLAEKLARSDVVPRPARLLQS